MSINVSNSTYGSTYQHRPSGHKSQPSVSFLDAMQKLATDRSAVSKRSDLERIFDKLSPASKNILECMKNGRNHISKEAWSSFCLELKNLGVIDENDYVYTRAEFHMIPIGYIDGNGNLVQYENIPIHADDRNTQYKQYITGSTEEAWTSNDWFGDPLKFMDDWLSSMQEWKSDLSVQRNPDGSAKYKDLSPITDQINSYQKVMDIVKNLMDVK